VPHRSSPSRRARSRPRFAAVGLDWLSRTRRGLGKRSRRKMSRNAPLVGGMDDDEKCADCEGRIKAGKVRRGRGVVMLRRFGAFGNVPYRRAMCVAMPSFSLHGIFRTLAMTMCAPDAAPRKYFHATMRIERRRWKRLFSRRIGLAILAQWPDREDSERRPHPSSLRGCWASLGRLPADRPSMISRPGALAMIGLITSPLRKPRSMCSSIGSMTSSMSCSGRNNQPIRRRRP